MHKRSILILLAACLGLVSIHAQTTNTDSFFLTGSPTAYRYNPAIAPAGDFIGIGGIDINSRANVGATTFLYDYGKKTVTGLHDSVSSQTLLDKLQKNNYLLTDNTFNLFSYGFHRGQASHNVELNIRNRGGVNLPKDLFVLMKTGLQQTSFDFSDTRIHSDMYAELAYGYTRKMSDIVSVGFRTKLLVGLASMDAVVKQLEIGMDDDIRMSFSSELDLTFRRRPKNNGTFLYPEYEKQPFRLPLVRGAGLAVDFGILIQPSPYLTLSLSTIDLGFLCWAYTIGGQVSTSFSLNEFTDFEADDMDAEDGLGLITGLMSDMEESATFVPKAKRFRVHGIPSGFNLGIKYAMPFYDRLSVGLTGHMTSFRTTRFWETRLGTSVNPLDWLDLNANFGYGTYGMSWGFAASVRVHKFRLHVSMSDSFGGRIPRLRLHLNPWNSVISAGLTFDL